MTSNIPGDMNGEIRDVELHGELPSLNSPILIVMLQGPMFCSKNSDKSEATRNSSHRSDLTFYTRCTNKQNWNSGDFYRPSNVALFACYSRARTFSQNEY